MGGIAHRRRQPRPVAQRYAAVASQGPAGGLHQPLTQFWQGERHAGGLRPRLGRLRHHPRRRPPASACPHTRHAAPLGGGSTGRLCAARHRPRQLAAPPSEPPLLQPPQPFHPLRRARKRRRLPPPRPSLHPRPTATSRVATLHQGHVRVDWLQETGNQLPRAEAHGRPVVLQLPPPG